MEARIQSQIIEFFSFLEDFYSTSKTCLKSCQNYAASINKIIRRCKNIKEAEITNTPLEAFVGLQSKLLSSLHNIINSEIQEIQLQLSAIEELFDKLCYKNKLLQDTCKDIDLSNQTPLIKGTPLQPPLQQILQFSTESVSFGSQICAQIETSLSVLSFKGLDTPHFVDNFKFPTNWQERISEILAYTSFCPENQI